MRALGIERPGVGDLLTLANAACGVGAILHVTVHIGAATPATLFDTLRPAVLLLVLGTVFDVLDGLAARRFGGTALGRPLDAMADAVTFGVTPAVLVGAAALPGTRGATAALVVVGVVVYLAAALLRLAHFSAQCDRPTHFTGLPSPLGAVCAVALLPLTANPVASGLALVALGALMISPVPYPLQSAAVAAVAITGWSIGFLAIAGVVDPVTPAVGILVVILVVVPVTSRARSTATARTAASP